eukprot:2686788-Pyramimonas_sp.AAC.1
MRRRGACGLELEIVAGRFTFLGPARLESLSCFRCAHRPAQRHCASSGPRCGSARRRGFGLSGAWR